MIPIFEFNPETFRPLRGLVELVEGDIVEQDVDAIVNAANSPLVVGGVVDGAIHSAAGPKLLKACRELGGCPMGSAKITSGFRLKARHVIHAVGPVYTGKAEDARLLSSAYRASIQLAVDHGLHSMAFPSISTGAYRYPIDEAAPLALRSVLGALESMQPEYWLGVRFVLFEARALRRYRRALASLFEDP